MTVRQSQIVQDLLPDSAQAYELDLTAPSGSTGTQRQREFASGRACAHAALGQLRVAGHVGRNHDRSPSWPAGAIGSISHCAHLAIAIAALDTHIGSLGVDVEESGAVSSDLTAVIFTPAEQRLLGTGAGSALRTALFSMKEASYKCWFPITGTVLEFTDIEVSADPATGQFRADMVTESRRKSRHVQTQGRFAAHGDHVFATAWVGPEVISG